MLRNSERHYVRDATRRGRVLVVGDIHGQFEMFQRLLKLAEFDSAKDFVYALGDLIDRGPDSPAVLNWFASPGRSASLMGNHEAMMLDALDDFELGGIWWHNGGEWSRHVTPSTMHLYRCMACQMPMTAELVYPSDFRVGLIHANIRPGVAWSELENLGAKPGDFARDWDKIDSASALWGRSRFQADAFLRSVGDANTMSADRRESVWKNIQPVEGIDLVISGHSPIPNGLPRGRGNVLWIDTGAGNNGLLTAVDPYAWTYWQVGKEASENWGPLDLPDLAPIPESLRPISDQC
ncbi:MAG: metallophosphoesterase [Pseudomonadota bacterium]|nr:metallophosphoesterase [Pseudomonadota bacterium]